MAEEKVAFMEYSVFLKANGREIKITCEGMAVGTNSLSFYSDEDCQDMIAFFTRADISGWKRSG